MLDHLHRETFQKVFDQYTNISLAIDDACTKTEAQAKLCSNAIEENTQTPGAHSEEALRLLEQNALSAYHIFLQTQVHAENFRKRVEQIRQDLTPFSIPPHVYTFMNGFGSDGDHLKKVVDAFEIARDQLALFANHLQEATVRMNACSQTFTPILNGFMAAVHPETKSYVDFWNSASILAVYDAWKKNPANEEIVNWDPEKNPLSPKVVDFKGADQKDEAFKLLGLTFINPHAESGQANQGYGVVRNGLTVSAEESKTSNPLITSDLLLSNYPIEVSSSSQSSSAEQNYLVAGSSALTGKEVETTLTDSPPEKIESQTFSESISSNSTEKDKEEEIETVVVSTPSPISAQETVFAEKVEKKVAASKGKTTANDTPQSRERSKRGRGRRR